MERLMLIVNPVSGKGQVRGALLDILTVFAAHGYAADVYLTQGRGDATAFAREQGADYPLVVCTGGDGTLSEVISGLVDLEKKPRLGYIPMGTANDVASTLHLSHTPAEAAKTAVTGREIPFDVGLLNGAHFSYVAAFGAFADVSYTTPQGSKRALGHLAYILEGIASLPSLHAIHAVVECPGQEPVEGNFIFGAVTNSTSVAGLMKIDPDAVSLGDGEFEVILVRTPKSAAELGNITNAVLTRNFNHKNVLMLHTDRIRFTFDAPIAWTRDGENGGEHRVVEAENLYRRIRMMIPPDAE